MRRRRPIATWAPTVLVIVLGMAGRAHALCPNCLGQSPELTPVLRLVGTFLLIPPAVFFAVAIAIRRLSGQSVPPSGGGGGGGDQAG